MSYRQSQEVVARREGDKTLIFQQKTGWLCILNSTSTFIWEHLNGVSSPAEITDLLLRCFDVPDEWNDPTRLRDLVEQHLDLLCKGQLLEQVTA